MSQTNPKRPKRKGIATARKDNKRQEAIQRQQRHAGRSTEQQLAILDSRPGNSTKERAKLGQGESS